MCYPPAADVQSISQMWVRGQCVLPAVLGNGKHERQCRVVESDRRGARDRSRHVGDAIVDDALLKVCGHGVRRRSASLETAALINRDVDDDCTRFHGSYELA